MRLGQPCPPPAPARGPREPGAARLRRLATISILCAATALATGGCWLLPAGAAPAPTPSPTPTPTPTPTPQPTDPAAMAAVALADLAGRSTLHADVTVSGTYRLDLTGFGWALPVALGGTTAVADVDLAGRRMAASLSAPSLLGLRADIAAADGAVFLRATQFLQGDRWVREPVTPGSLAEAAADPARTFSAIAAVLARPGASATRLADEAVGGTPCAVVAFTIPAADFSAPGTLGSVVAGSLARDVPAVAWVRAADLGLAKLALDLDLGSRGAVHLDVTFTNLDQPVSVLAPPADQVAP